MNCIEVNNICFYRVNNDVYGNPRYVVHFFAFLKENEFPELTVWEKFQIAHKRAKKAGFAKYRGRNFGGGFVCQSYSLQETAKDILQVRGE